MDATVGVIGLGAIGSQALMQLSLAGVSTVGFDRSTTPNDRSGHAGETRLVLAMSEGPESESQEKITAGTLTAWEKFEAVTGHSVLMRNGSLLLGRAGEDRTNFLVSSAEKLGEPLQVLDQRSAKEKFPQFNLDSEEVAVHDPRGGGVRSEWAVWGAISTARRNGAQIRTSEEVLGWAPEQGCVRVFTTVREYKFEKVIVSTGAYAKSLVPTVPVVAHWLAMAWFAPETEYSEMFRPKNMPVFSWGEPFSRVGDMIYGAPSLDEAYLKIGGDYNWGDSHAVKDENFRASWDDLSGLRAKARGNFNHLSDSVVRSIKLVDGWSQDASPLVGFMPDSDRVFLATGFTGYGFMISPLMGQLVAESVAKGSSSIDLSEFSPARFDSVRHGFTQ